MDNTLHTASYPRVGALSIPDDGSGEAGLSVLSLSLPYGLLLAVADGTAREVRERRVAERRILVAVKRVLQGGRANPDDGAAVVGLLKQALSSANSDLRQYNQESSEGDAGSASAVLVLIARGRAYVAHVGSARLYLVRNGTPNRMTRDHTTAQSWIDHGIMTEEQARERPEAHSLARALGEKRQLEPGIRSLPIHLERGDVLVLSSAGVHRHLGDDEIASMVERLEPEHACQELCEVARTRSRDPDAKAVVYRSGPPRQGKHPRLLQQKRLRAQRQRVLLGIATALAAVLVMWLIASFWPSGSSPEQERTAAQSGTHLATEAADVRAGPLHPALADIRTQTGTGLEEVVWRRPEPPPESDARTDESTAPADLAAAAPDASAMPRDVAAEPDEVMPVAEVRSEPPDAAVRTAEPEVVAAVPEVSEPEVPSESAEKPPAAEDERVDHCVTDDLNRKDRQRVRDLRFIVREGLRAVQERDAARAAGRCGAARQTLRSSSPVVQERCAAKVEELRTALKERYLKLTVVSSSRAIEHPKEKSWRCDKAHRMARDARRFGATDEEIKVALRICAED